DNTGVQAISVLESDEKLTEVVPEPLQEVVYQLNEYFEGKRTSFDLQLNPKGTAFQKRVWEALLEIPFGKTLSYLELALKLGDVKAIRAVAAANGKNPIWIVIPCHRVISSDGALTGYAGGLHRKKWLLDHESPVIQQTLF
ncbi:MAG: methylated-DNA--[protein]-cysteine S-methyltransferase, partial [Eudoraea sp.]|nr:methylated-DNA--[protein]-cysteine S-methyltransferase [Eudoraea sp.]